MHVWLTTRPEVTRRRGAGLEGEEITIMSLLFPMLHFHPTIRTETDGPDSAMVGHSCDQVDR